MKIGQKQRKEGQRIRAARMAARREMITTRTIAKGRRQPGEARPVMVSVASFCSECMTSYGDDCGGAPNVRAAVEGCTCRECHLWPWRYGKARPEEILLERLDAG
jgi:hypothetical protein